MSKLPWMKLWFEDLDRDCGALSLAARGAWMWIIGDLHRKEGARSLTLEGWSRVIGGSSNQTAAVLTEIINNKICDSNLENVTRDSLLQKSDALITIKSRRIIREEAERQKHAARQSKYRTKQKAENTRQGTKQQGTKGSDANSDGGVTPIEAEAEAKKQEKKAKNSSADKAADARFQPLVDYFFKRYLELRGHRLFAVPADFKGLEALLKRTAGQDDFSIENIEAAMDRFLSSADAFHKKQGKPLAYFCGNINAFRAIQAPADTIGKGKLNGHGAAVRAAHAEFIRKKEPGKRNREEAEFLELFDSGVMND
jgi:hypothetical protein